MSHEESHVVCSEPRLPRVSVHVDPARLHRRSFSLRPHRLAMGVRHLHVALVVVLALPVPGVEIVIDASGEQMGSTHMLRREEAYVTYSTTPHPCTDKTLCSGCEGLGRSTCESACWKDEDEDRNRQCVWTTLWNCTHKAGGAWC
ncbi:unnamed protein product [Durusdinium trenchii]|uniref:Uncharacterized protein n=2 Tax=Durusdinium trenchii TaxID=1381693 RepID=A0ABP0RB35_9DINO